MGGVAMNFEEELDVLDELRDRLFSQMQRMVKLDGQRARLPPSSVPLALLRDLQVTGGEIASISAELQQLIRRFVQQALARARECLAGGRPSEAQRLAERVLELDPQNDEAKSILQEGKRQERIAELYTKGIAAFNEERWEAALEFFAEVVDTGPEYPAVSTKLAEARKQKKLAELYELGRVHSLNKDWDEAIATFRYIIEEERGYRDVRARLAEAIEAKVEVLLSGAVFVLEKGSIDSAIEVLKEAAKLDPSMETSDLFANVTQDVISELRTYAIAQFQGHEDGQPFYVGHTYFLRTGVLREIPRGFKGEPISLPQSQSVIELDMVVWAQDMKVEPHWNQTLKFYRGRDSGLLEFRLTPEASGRKSVRVEFYYQRHWLQQLKFEVEVVETKELIPA
jgi:tetratricopeptide (TPR) repeat protein